MEDIIISKMKMNDLDQIREKIETEFDDFWNVNILKSELEKDNSLYYVAKNEEKILGFVGININFDYVELMNIVVRKDSRNQGIGEKLLLKIIEETLKLNKNAVYLEVSEKNYNAIKLYKKKRI